jgi:uncharacterized protein (DUF302 family)
MKQAIIFGIIGLIVGAGLMMLIMYLLAPKMMLLEDESKYDFDKTVEVLTQSIEDHDWKLPAVHDLKETMHKYGKDVRNVKVFELCHPDHAEQILKESEERIVSSMMPCRIAIYEKEDGKVYISRMNSSLMASTMGGVIKKTMSVAAAENEVILEAIIKK